MPANKPFKFRFANELAGGLILLALLILAVSMATSGQVRELFTRRTTIKLNLPREGSMGLKEGADVVYHDPVIPEFEEHGLEMKSTALTQALVEGVDLVIVLTDHTTIDYQWVTDHAKAVLRRAGIECKPPDRECLVCGPSRRSSA